MLQPLLLSVYVAPPPAEVLHCSLCLDRLPVHSSLLFLVFLVVFVFFEVDVVTAAAKRFVKQVQSCPDTGGG